MSNGKKEVSAVPRSHELVRWFDILAALLICCGLVGIYTLSLDRSYFGYGTETDYVGSMVLEAEKLIAGEALASEFHPPGFIIAMAIGHFFKGDWFWVGKSLSIISFTLTMITAYGMFRLIAGPLAGLGAIVGLLSSAVFLKYAMQTTSDVFYLALYYSTCLLAVYASVRKSFWLWLGVGILIIISTMTRTNGITLLLLLALPLFQSRGTDRIRLVAGCVAGLGFALLAFAVFAVATESNLMPAGTYHNIAITYFTEERISWEGMIEARSRFDSLADVLTHDPVTMAKSYIRDLLDIILRRIPLLAGPALALLFLPGLLYTVGQHHRPLVGFFFVLTLAQLLLVNLKAFEARYHLYFVPWIGVGALLSLSLIAERKDWAPKLRIPVLSMSVAIVLVGGLYAWTDTRRFAKLGGNPELARVLPIIQPIIGPNDVIVSRKSAHLAYYTGAASAWLPNVESEGELQAALVSAQTKSGAKGGVFLFLGEVEKRMRPETVSLVSKGDTLPWLVEVTESKAFPNWKLLHYRPQD